MKEEEREYVEVVGLEGLRKLRLGLERNSGKVAGWALHSKGSRVAHISDKREGPPDCCACSHTTGWATWKLLTETRYSQEMNNRCK